MAKADQKLIDEAQVSNARLMEGSAKVILSTAKAMHQDTAYNVALIKSAHLATLNGVGRVGRIPSAFGSTILCSVGKCAPSGRIKALVQFAN